MTKISDELRQEALELYNIDVDAVLKANNATSMRILREDSLATADYVADRVNVIVNHKRQILKIYNG
jgi:hypothetical protein